MRLRPMFPVPESPGQIVMTLGRPPQAIPISVTRFMSKDRTAAVTVSTQNMVVETIRYSEYANFRPLLTACLESLHAVQDAIVGFERVGLRYVNEIRVPGLRDAAEWEHYLAPKFVAPLSVMNHHPISLMQTVVQTEPEDNVMTLVRFGALRGQALLPGGALSLPAHSPSDPFFLLDIDNSWSSTDSFDDDAMRMAGDIYDRLHAPIDALFEAAITDRLRDV